MSKITVRLFGKFSAFEEGIRLTGLDTGKVQELFAYLLVYRDRPHPREQLASLLWEAASTSLGKKYLRQAIWHLQSTLGSESKDRLLLIEPDWIRIRPDAEFRLDLELFEQAFGSVQGVRGSGLGSEQAEALQEAVRVYRSDLLEGWYQDWCLYERERLQNMWLAILDKLMAYCEAHKAHEAGLVYGTRVLRHDRARERTHRRMMRLYYLAGDRTGALRQYDRCATALDEELGVKPARRTEELRQVIQEDTLAAARPIRLPDAPGSSSAIPKVIVRLSKLQKALFVAQDHVVSDIEALKKALGDT